MSRHAKILLIIFIIALAVIVYFIMFGKKNATTGTATDATAPGVSSILPITRTAGGVTDPAQRYIGSGRPGVTPIATT
jgi:flagellar basal body-associated protein FliL